MLLQKTNFTRILSVAALCLGAAACGRETTPEPAAIAARATTANATAPGFPEGFETGTKAAYATGTVALGSGSWTLADALIGNTSADAKTGSWSVRVRNSGSLGMNFDLTGGAGVVTVAHATYGADGSGTWELWASGNSGGSYAKVGSTVTSSSAALSTASFTVNLAGPVRLQVRKTDGGTNRLSFDNITVTTGSGTPPPPPPGGGGTPPPSTGGKKFLFDAGHAEPAGNADWVVMGVNNAAPRFPSPAQSGITASTPESYWTGALSSWGVALVKLGNSVESLPQGVAITYGNAANPQDLANYNVYVVDEPNTLFTASEKAAIVRFVQNGGGLFMISDHNISDRNNDGYDSPAIWNDLMRNNGVQANPFGFSIELTNFSETSTNVSTTASPVLNGTQGAVHQLVFNNGASVAVNSSAAQGLIWKTSVSQGSRTGIMCASSTFGTGRVVVVSDSSPADDGTGEPGNNLFPGWAGEANGDHARLHLNASLWLAKQQ